MLQTSQALLDYYRCREQDAQLRWPQATPSHAGYFDFEGITCFGRLTSGSPAPSAAGTLPAAPRPEPQPSGRLPFVPDEVIDNLRLERYAEQPTEAGASWSRNLVRQAYYGVRPLLPVKVRRPLQRAYLSGWKRIPFPRWPVDVTVERLMKRLLLARLQHEGRTTLPFIWFWPAGRRCAVMLTHDVETAAGRDYCPHLMDIDDAHGLKSAFQIVPEKRYEIPEPFVDGIKQRGFEVNIHGLDHDGRLFDSRAEFLQQVERIHAHARKHAAAGFRSPVLYRNLEWFGDLQFAYDMSVPNVAHLDPQRGGCCTVLPYFVGEILELPLTTTQDYTLFHVLGDYSLALWNQQIELIQAQAGLVSFNIHPDYIQGKREAALYEALLQRVKQIPGAWFARPGEINTWWRQRHALQLREQNGGWVVDGPGAERARVALATLQDGEIVYRVEGNP